MNKTKISIFNGGRGATSIIKKLKSVDNIEVTSIVNAYDDGKSTGEIRDFFQMLGPSDLRKVQSAFLDESDINYENNLNFFDYRLPHKIKNQAAVNLIKNLFNNENNTNNNPFGINQSIYFELKKYVSIFLKELNVIENNLDKKFNFDNCSLMNCIYAGAYIHNKKDLISTINHLSNLFNIRCKVLPNSLDNLRLLAIREDGEVLLRESDIVSLRSNVKIHKIFLIDYRTKINPEHIFNLSFNDKIKYLENLNSNCYLSENVKKIIEKSDIMIFCPGTQHSSLLPTYLSLYLGDIIANNKESLKVFISNIGADYENPVYIASDYVLNSVKHLNYSSKKNYEIKDFFNLLLINNPLDDIKVKVKFDNGIIKTNIDYVKSNLENDNKNGYHDGDKIIEIIFKKFREIKKNY